MPDRCTSHSPVVIADFKGNNLAANSPANERFLIPELLDAVFRLADTPDLVSLALVCKSWSEVALDCLWEDRLGTVLPLLQFLAPSLDVYGEYYVSLRPQIPSYS